MIKILIEIIILGILLALIGGYIKRSRKELTKKEFKEFLQSIDLKEVEKNMDFNIADAENIKRLRLKYRLSIVDAKTLFDKIKDKRIEEKY